MSVVKQKYHVRWMIRRDMEHVLGIERASFGSPWTERDFQLMLKQRNNIGMICESPRRGIDRPVGFMVYELCQSELIIRNFAVHPDWRHQGVGTAMIDKLKTKLSATRRGKASVSITETNLDGQLFFKQCGFIATEIVRGARFKVAYDSYLMEYFV